MRVTNIERFLDRCYGLVDTWLQAAADANEAALVRLRTVVARHRDKLPTLWSDPLALAYFVAREADAVDSEPVHEFGAATLLYFFALRLFDDIQDHELDGLDYEGHTGRAINDAAVLFSLAMHGIHRVAIAQPRIAPRLFELVQRVSIRSYDGQDRDLGGSARGTAEALEVAKRKSSTTTLIIEGAALVGAADPATCLRWRRVAGQVGEIFQLLNDVADVYGKPISADLTQGRRTYLLECFAEVATVEQQQRLAELRHDLPESQAAVRELLYHSGALERLASTLQRTHGALHRTVMTIDGPGVGRRELLIFVDNCVSRLFGFPPPGCSRTLLEPDVSIHRELRALLLDAAKDPELRCVPWFRARVWWASNHQTLYYPDAWPDARPSPRGDCDDPGDVVAELRRYRPDLTLAEAQAVARVGAALVAVQVALDGAEGPPLAAAIERLRRRAPERLEALPVAVRAITRAVPPAVDPRGTLADPRWWVGSAEAMPLEAMGAADG